MSERALDLLIPEALKRTGRPNGAEWVYPPSVVREVLEIAGRNRIAVLGVELFRYTESGLLTVAMSGYDYAVTYEGDWDAFVSKNRQLALEFIAENQEGAGYGYILTTASQDEFHSGGLGPDNHA